MASGPGSLTLKRHRELEGLYWQGLVARWVAYAVLLTVVVLALANVFGQRPATWTAEGPEARLTVYAPNHLRGGLLYMARFHVTARQDLKKATLVLDPGWAESISINTIEPSPVGEASKNGRLSFELGHIPAGQSFVLYMDFQVNPTNVGRRRQDVELWAGDTHLLSIERTATIYP